MSSHPPILLLKTKSTPHDGYEQYFSSNGYTPTFIPVLEHRFHRENLDTVREFFASGAFNTDTATPSPHHDGHKEDSTSTSDKKYGGMIFTSQRAVEAFAEMIAEKGLPFTPSKQTPSKQTPSLPLYTVGPATARALTTLRNKYLPTATIHGADAGNGQKLAYLMLEHYNGLYPDTNTATKPSLLFLVGEQRRDIIPKTLMDPSRSEDERINVDEIVVYETGEMDSFENDFRDVVSQELEAKAERKGPLWVVVFSPTGCEGMLRVLKMGPFKDLNVEGQGRDVFVATIGPTTRDYLRETFGFEADVCAEKPSPEGIAEGIKRFMDERGH